MKKILVIIVALVAIALLLPRIAGKITWDGGAYREFSITVLDNDTDRPIEGAEILMLRDSDFRYIQMHDESKREALLRGFTKEGYAKTNSEGIAETGRRFPAGGENSLWMKTGMFIVSGPLRITKEGYREFKGLLQNIVGQKRFPLSKGSFSFTIYLDRKPEP